MKPNPVLRRLGLSDNDRAAIIHTDDIGMCQASITAFTNLWEFGLISSGAVMMPCPWAPQAVNAASALAQADLGVHSTITSEWSTYRWGPLSTRDPQSGLVDEFGFFFKSTREVQEHADPECVQIELEAQVQQALRFGLQPTHLDTHMGAVGSMRFMPIYISVALKYRLPPMIFRMEEQDWLAHGIDPSLAGMAPSLMNQLEEAGLPLLDAIVGMDLGAPENRLEQAKQAFSELKPGITHFILHPSVDTPELRAIAPDWRARAADYETFMSDELRRFIQSQGIQVIGYRAIQALMPDPSSAPPV